MSNSSLQERIKLEIDKANESLKGAQLLLKANLYSEKVENASKFYTRILNYLKDKSHI